MEEKISAILQQVSDLYQKYGIKSVSMDDVARELSISKKTLYECFADKEDLVIKVLEFQMSKIRTVFDVEKDDSTNAIDHLLEISHIITAFLTNFSPTVHYDLQKYYPSVFRSMFEYKRGFMHDSIKANLGRGIKDGLYRSDFNPDIVAQMYVNQIESSLGSGFISSSEFTTHELFSEMFTYHIRGIASKKGLEYFEKKICLTTK
ncbi:MAG TPA: TetR/AcrR family transcriptional regulator [Bacteroidales bacterium]|nr:TetR/AcrR family transcriptional regulator [Bacteroidales bacterium]HPS27775.1 TetR/AcrR family transcriptional regulator [Bacteroidales bacterium]